MVYKRGSLNHAVRHSRYAAMAPVLPVDAFPAVLADKLIHQTEDGA